jgi:hypothetical protein
MRQEIPASLKINHCTPDVVMEAQRWFHDYDAANKSVIRISIVTSAPGFIAG